MGWVPDAPDVPDVVLLRDGGASFRGITLTLRVTYVVVAAATAPFFGLLGMPFRGDGKVK